MAAAAAEGALAAAAAAEEEDVSAAAIPAAVAATDFRKLHIIGIPRQYEINHNDTWRKKTMANQIRITPDQMRERANQYRTEADTVNGVINKMDSLLSQLQAEWEGAASESYAARYQELKPGFMKAEELIREIAAALDSTARIVEETDSDIANQFRG